MVTISERASLISGPQIDHPSHSSPAGRPALTPLERLRQLVEAAPAAVIVTSPDGAILAANGEAAALLGVHQRDELLGSTLADRVADDDRERFRHFADQVCAGEPGMLEYRLLGAGGSVRWVETRAVALSRDQGARSVFLSVTWDVTDRKRTADAEMRQLRTRAELLDAQLVAQHEAYESALQDARAATDRMKKEWANERGTLAATLRRARARLQTKLAEAGANHERAVAEAEAERESLVAKLRDAEDRQTSAEALADDRARQLATLETQYAVSIAERNEDRAQCHALLDQRERWRVKLSEVLEAMSQTPAGAPRLHAAGTHADPTVRPGAAANRQSAEDSQWEF